MGQLRTTVMMMVLVLGAAVHSPAQTTDKASIAGAWILNKDLSDASPGAAGTGDQGGDTAHGRGGRGSGGGGGYGHHGGGGYGRMGGGGGGGRNGGGGSNPEEMARMRDAMHDLANPSDHLTITQTDSMIVITGADGRTTRLSPDGKKIKDDNTKIERKTKWDGGKLVTEINGLGSGKITQTLAVDQEHKQLRLTVVMEGGRSGQPRTMTQVYDVDTK
jgi:hypothetical protein